MVPIRINIKFLRSKAPTFDDNSLIVASFHEIGHLHYFLNTPIADRNPENSEKTAFEYSLLQTKEGLALSWSIPRDHVPVIGPV